MGITQQGRYLQTGCHYLRKKRAITITYQYIGVLTLAKACNECESFAGVKWKVGREDFRLTFECLLQRLGRYATARSKEAVEENYFCNSNCSFAKCFSIIYSITLVLLQYHLYFVDTVKFYFLIFVISLSTSSVLSQNFPRNGFLRVKARIASVP